MTLKRRPPRIYRPALGKYKFVCDRCGFEYSSDEIRKEWTGFVVCSGCLEIRNPVETFKWKPESPPPRILRPPQRMEASTCDVRQSSATVGYAVVGCTVVGDILVGGSVYG